MDYRKEGKYHAINFAILICKINIYVGKLKEKVEQFTRPCLCLSGVYNIVRGVRDMYGFNTNP